MFRTLRFAWFAPAWSVLVVAPLAVRAAEPQRVQFNRDVRPILSNNCFVCHGPDAGHRKGELRLDLREAAVEAGAIVPGKPEQSTLVARIGAHGDEQMPPAEANKTLTDGQKDVLRRWIAEGAEYQKHWSYEPPVKAAIPAGENGVDHLVRKRLAVVGLTPSPEADRRTLIRRLYSDLLGLPPTPEETAAFEADERPDAYQRLVERVLANPHYGERMAQGWLDVVRFADTIGYHSDNPRNVWPYRDWVIAAFNDDQPFDRFTIEQLAGDLLPDATMKTRIGSAFNRLLLSTEEGGAQAKDYEARMLTDRVRAVGAAWLGQTTGCGQCHDHKFDPFTMRDFYSLGAFFADLQEPIIGRREDGIVVAPEADQKQLAALDAELAAARKTYDAAVKRLDAGQTAWEARVAADARELTQPTAAPEAKPQAPKTTESKTIEPKTTTTAPKAKASEPKTTTPGAKSPEAKASDSKTEEARRKAAPAVVAVLKKAAKDRNPKEKETLQTYYRTYVDATQRAELEAFAQLEARRKAFYDALPKCIVSVGGPNRRTVRILPRGNWMDESGEVMQPALPAYLPQPKSDGRPLTRLDLARWLVSRENPLTARTVMNRLWKQLFGLGLSKVLDDLGAQGEPPPNPELLDWLACEFRDSGWQMKHMVRLIVTSKTYRRTSTASPELLAKDPYNREHARQSAFRIDAELVRDYALAVSGLLSPKIGGPSVKPYQPDGYWENLNFPTRQYAADPGEAQYRRGLYTWWQRSFLHPSLLAFDAPSREECCAERSRSNIPQQALVLLNDPTYVEASRVLATRVLAECRGSTSDRIVWAWRRTLQRAPRADELQTVERLLAEHRQAYAQQPAEAEKLLKVGQTPPPAGVDPVELAAWTHVARVLLNLHETITRS